MSIDDALLSRRAANDAIVKHVCDVGTGAVSRIGVNFATLPTHFDQIVMFTFFAWDVDLHAQSVPARALLSHHQSNHSHKWCSNTPIHLPKSNGTTSIGTDSTNSCRSESCSAIKTAMGAMVEGKVSHHHQL